MSHLYTILATVQGCRKGSLQGYWIIAPNKERAAQAALEEWPEIDCIESITKITK